MNENDKKLEKLTKLAELLRDDTITPSQAKQLVELLINLNKQQKDELVKTFDGFTAEAYVKIQEAVSMVSQKHADALLEVRQLTNKQKKAHEDMMAKCMDLLMEIKSIDVQDGIDGKDADEEKIVQDVLALIPKPEIVVLDDREKIVTKINSGKKNDEKIDASQIKNLPQSVQTIVQGGGFIETPLKAGANITITKDASGANVITGSAGGGTWGSITGTLSSQTDLQSALDLKAPLTSPTFATSITGSYLTASEILITNASKQVISAPVATYPSLTELTYLKGVTSAIQTQIDGKIDGTMVSTRIPIGSDSNTLTTDADLTYDATNNVLTVGGITMGKYGGEKGFQVTTGQDIYFVTNGDYMRFQTVNSSIDLQTAAGGTHTTFGINYGGYTGSIHVGNGGAFMDVFPIAGLATRIGANGTLGYLQINTSGLIQLHGTTSSYPALKRNGAAINFRLADDSADAAITTAGITASGTVALGTNNLTMTGSLATTGARVTKGWFTDIESTNAPTIGGTAATGSGGLARATSPSLVTPLLTVLVEANTAGVGSPNIITDAESFTTYTNEGATALNYHTLPTAVAGLTYTFYVDDADGIRITANTGDIIQINGVASASAGYAECTAIGGSLTLVAINAVDWVATSVVGTWTLV